MMFFYDNDMSCIINNPEETMKNPLIDVDLNEAIEIIIDVSKRKLNKRQKSVIGIVRGKGSAKTRFLEEIRRNIIVNRSNILVIAITFNNNTDLDDEWNTSSPKEWYALSIISRLICSYYEISFNTACLYVEDFFKTLKKTNSSAIDAALLLKAFFIHFIVNERKSRDTEININCFCR
jgi:hypothetical protein